MQVDTGPAVRAEAAGPLALLRPGPRLRLGGRGLVGCLAQLSIGNMFNIDMLGTAVTSHNVQPCQ